MKKMREAMQVTSRGFQNTLWYLHHGGKLLHRQNGDFSERLVDPVALARDILLAPVSRTYTPPPAADERKNGRLPFERNWFQIIPEHTPSPRSDANMIPFHRGLLLFSSSSRWWECSGTNGTFALGQIQESGIRISRGGSEKKGVWSSWWCSCWRWVNSQRDTWVATCLCFVMVSSSKNWDDSKV